MATGNVIPKHFTDQDILFELQHGFRDMRSNKTQLIMLVDELAKACKSENKQTFDSFLGQLYLHRAVKGMSDQKYTQFR